MPRGKKADTSDSDSGPNDVGPAAKKSKVDNKSTPKSSGDASGDQTSWDLGRNRKLELTEFKGKWYVSVREFYDANGEMKPSKKGIMLTMEQYQKMRSCMDELDQAIKRHV